MKFETQSHPSRRAFTLIELLVVIAVIAVLMGILMPALGRARKQARTSACLAQLKQWGLIWSMYCQDNNNRFPSGMIDRNALNTNINFPRGQWVTVLQNGWEKNPGLLKCPSATKEYPPEGSGDAARRGGPTQAYSFPEYMNMNDEYCSYGINTWVYSKGNDLGKRWRTIDKLEQANEIPIMADSMWRGGGPQWSKANSVQPPRENGEWSGQGFEIKHFAMDRHVGGINILAGDFSTRKVRVRQLWELRWHRGFDIRRSQKQDETWWGPWLSRMQ